MVRGLLFQRNCGVKRSKKVRGLRFQRNCGVVSVGGKDLKSKDFELRAKPPKGPQAQALTVPDSPVYHALGNLRWRRFRDEGDRTGRESLELRQPSLPVKIRTLRSQ